MQIKCEIGSELQLSLYDLNDNLLEESGWLHNHVLDSGLTYLSTDITTKMLTNISRMDITRYLNIGRGRSTVTNDQTGLDDYVATTERTLGSDIVSVEYDDTAKRWFIEITTFYMFKAGAIEGSFTELGLSLNPNDTYFNRVIIKDANGDPTTVVIDSKKWLSVRVRIKLYIDDNIRGSLKIIDAEREKNIGFTQYFMCTKTLYDNKPRNIFMLTPPAATLDGVSTNNIDTTKLREMVSLPTDQSLADGGCVGQTQYYSENRSCDFTRSLSSKFSTWPD